MNYPSIVVPLVTDSSPHQVSELNQQTYQRLKLALSLNLRRQIFIAVCDDLTLRDRMAAQLAKQANRLRSSASGSPAAGLVSLHLNLHNPNPSAQIAQWLARFGVKHKTRYGLIPDFQVLGIEQLTRQPAAVQRSFLTHLQGLERNLPMLESSLLLWMPQPWFWSLPHAAPDFWRCRTAVFEFAGDPTPLSTQPLEYRYRQQRPPSPDRAKPATAEVSAAATPQPAQVLEPKNWEQLSLAPVLMEKSLAEAPEVNDPDPDPGSLHQATLQGSLLPLQSNQITASGEAALSKSAPEQGTKTAVLDVTPALAPTSTVESPSKPDSATGLELSAPVTAHPVAPQDASLLMLQQIEQLQHQQATPAELSEAYRRLGDLYRDRIEQGDATAQNLAIAIRAYEQVVQHLPEQATGWVDLLNDLGNLYWMLARSAPAPTDTIAFLQQAIQAYQLALAKVDSTTAQTQLQGVVHNNLGATYADLARHQDAAENLQRSVQAYEQALRYRKAEVDPLRYASTQNNLGTTYWNLAQHQQPAFHLKQAIAAYSEALRYYKSAEDAVNYAMIQNNLGTAYWNLAQYERAQDWLLLAVNAYRMALRYRTLETNPVAYAATQNNLGTAFWHLASQQKGNPESQLANLQQAIAAYQAALHAVDRLTQQIPAPSLNFDPCATHNNLGLAHYQAATDPQLTGTLGEERLSHLISALGHHLQALEGWQLQANFRQTALQAVLQTVRAAYSHAGLAGQNQALSKIPAHLLPEILPKL